MSVDAGRSFGPGRDPVASVSHSIKSAAPGEPVAILMRERNFVFFCHGVVASVVDFCETAAEFTVVFAPGSTRLARVVSPTTVSAWAETRGAELHVPRLGRTVGNVKLVVWTGSGADRALEDVLERPGAQPV